MVADAWGEYKTAALPGADNMYFINFPVKLPNGGTPQLCGTGSHLRNGNRPPSGDIFISQGVLDSYQGSQPGTTVPAPSAGTTTTRESHPRRCGRHLLRRRAPRVSGPACRLL